MRDARPVVVVGAGLSGLACALRLEAAGLPVRLLEAGHRPGGRVRTDTVDGFRLDRGFQVFPTAYETLSSMLDLEALRLHPFRSGALVRVGGSFHRLSDPSRHPGGSLGTALAPVGTAREKLRLGRYAIGLRGGSLADALEVAERTTEEELRDRGLHGRLGRAFLVPLLAGVLLDPTLRTSGRMARFALTAFARGPVCLPAGGMEAIPRQLAARLAVGTLRTGARVARARSDAVVLQDGEEVPAAAVVLAVEAPALERLAPGAAGRSSPGRGALTVYYAAESAPVEEPVLVLNGYGGGPVNHLAVPSRVAPGYAPPGAELIAVSVLDASHGTGGRLDGAIRRQLAGWFGPSVVHGWRLLETVRVRHAAPGQRPEEGGVAPRPARLRPGLYLAGDHREHGSLEGAVLAGERAADALLADLAGRAPGEGRPAFPAGRRAPIRA